MASSILNIIHKVTLRAPTWLFFLFGLILPIGLHYHSEVISFVKSFDGPRKKELPTVIIASGSHGGVYAHSIESLRLQYFAEMTSQSPGEPLKEKIEIRESGGSNENIELLRSGKVHFAIVQSDVADQAAFRADFQKVSERFVERLIFVTADPDIAARTETGHWQSILRSNIYAMPNPKMGSHTTAMALLKHLKIHRPSEREYESVSEAIEDVLNHTISGFFLVSGDDNPLLKIAQSSGENIFFVEFPEFQTSASIYVTRREFGEELSRSIKRITNHVKGVKN